jgi:Domain of unknown function (DUF4267)
MMRQFFRNEKLSRQIGSGGTRSRHAILPAAFLMEMSMTSTRDLQWRSPLTLILMLACILFLGLGARTFFLPEAASAFFGAPATSPEALVFVKAYGARNIAIALTALALIRLDFRPGLVALLAFAALVAALDASVMYGFSGMAGAAKHMIYVVVLGGLSRATARLGRVNAAAPAATALHP